MSKRNFDNLRRKAEEKLAANEQKLKGMGKADLATMAQELAVHQAELEIQNEKLIESKALMEQTKDRYQQFFDFAPVGYFTLDEHNRIVEANLTGCQIIKMDKGKLKNKVFTRFIADGETDYYYIQRKKALETELRQNFVLQMKKDDGTLFYAQLDIIKGNEAKLRLAVSDITERKKAEDAQKKSEENYRTLFNSIDEGFCVIEVIFDSRNKPIDYRFLEINPSFEKQTGLHDAEGKLMRDLAPDHEKHWFRIYGRIALTGKAERFINEARALNRWYDVYAFRVGTPESRKVAVLFNDITARKKAEDDLAKAKDELEIKVQERTSELSASEEKYRTLLNSIPDEVWFADINKNFTLANPAALHEFGNAAAGIEVETLAKSLEVYRPDGTIRPVEEAPPLRALQGEVILGQEEIVKTPFSGELRYRQVSAAPVKDISGKIIGAVSVVRDVTESKKVEEQLHQRAEELETVMKVVPAAIWVAHDPACHNITGNQTANRFYEAEEGENVSAGPAPGERVPERRFFRNGKELTAEELPMQEVAARNVDIQGAEFNVLLSSGKSRTLWGSASPLRNDDGQVRGVVAAFVDITDRTLEQQKLKESEERYRELFVNMTEGFALGEVILDGEGKPADYSILEANQAWEKMTGLSFNQIAGKPLKQLIPGLEQYWIDSYGKVALTGEPLHLENYNKFTEHWYAIYAYSPRKGYFVSLVSNVTERKKAEEELRQMEERNRLLADILENASQPFGIGLPDGRLGIVNKAFCDLTGYTTEELRTLDWAKVLTPPEYLPMEAEKLNALVKTGQPVRYQKEYIRKDNSRVPIELLVHLVRDADGQAEYYYSFLTDITERTEAEKRLKESEEKFSKIFHSSPVGLVMTHLPDGRWVDANETYFKMLGYNREEVIGRTSGELNLYPDGDKRTEIFRNLQEQRKISSVELRLLTKSGRIIETLSSVEIIKLGGEEYSVSTNVDITDRKKTESEIIRLNRELSAIRECDQAIVHAKDEQILLNDICRILKETAGYRMAWIGTVEHDENKTVRPVAWSSDEEYVKNAKITWSETDRGQGPTGLAVRTGKTHYFQDFTTEAAAAPWRKAALAMDYRSSIAIPLFDDEGMVFGVFTAYSPIPNYFNESEIRLLETLARDISFGVNALRDGIKWEQAKMEISHLASFPELNPNPVIELDSKGAVIYVNPAAKTHFPFITQGNKQPFLMDFINSLKNMGTESITKDIKIGDSWYEETLTSVSSTKNYLLYARDITGRKNAELALQETRDYLRNLLDYANAPIIVWDPLFHIAQFNHAFERLTGRTAEDVIGKRLDILFPEEQKSHAMEHIRRAVSGERMQVEEIAIQHKDGSVRTVIWNSATLYDQDNKTPLATIAQGQDITERKAAEDELKQRTIDLEASNKELETFSYSVSHDLRAPLRSITGFSNVLLEDYSNELDNEGKSYLKKISDSGELMGQLIDDLLKLSRVTRTDLTIEKLDLSVMAQKIVTDLAKDEPKRDVKVTIAPNMSANGDKNLLGLVLQNLLGNAWKYTSKTAEPRIEMGVVEYKGKQAYFVRDNGVGFDIAYANKLFKPFQRLHKATEFAGTGIGLATVQRIIHRHGGEVWAEAKVGEGATFYFTLN